MFCYITKPGTSDLRLRRLRVTCGLTDEPLISDRLSTHPLCAHTGEHDPSAETDAGWRIQCRRPIYGCRVLRVQIVANLTLKDANVTSLSICSINIHTLRISHNGSYVYENRKTCMNKENHLATIPTNDSITCANVCNMDDNCRSFDTKDKCYLSSNVTCAFVKTKRNRCSDYDKTAECANAPRCPLRQWGRPCRDVCQLY